MPLPAEVHAALERSQLGALPADALARLTEGALALDVPAGTELIPPASIPRLHLMVAGLGKTYLIAPNGRQATVRYARSGDLVAGSAVCDLRPCLPGFRTLSAAAVLIFNMENVRFLARTDVRVANAFNREMADRLHAYFAELAGTTFGSLRERVVRHLLDVASEQQRGEALVARLSQQQLADAVGSVREVVARLLGKLREEGLLRTGDGEVELLDPGRLAGEVKGGATWVTREGDKGR
ncbi:MAG TPA: Crp/Fnr family transcriptional regulator [Myxococcales bacterium]|nr:Crp/Fnr family transcriptional regulator [Myxococcales bacterium]